MNFLIFLVALAILVLVVGDGLDEIRKSLSKISNSLNVLADHVEHSCDKCKAEAEEEESSD